MPRVPCRQTGQARSLAPGRSGYHTGPRERSQARVRIALIKYAEHILPLVSACGGEEIGRFPRSFEQVERAVLIAVCVRTRLKEVEANDGRCRPVLRAHHARTGLTVVAEPISMAAMW